MTTATETSVGKVWTETEHLDPGDGDAYDGEHRFVIVQDQTEEFADDGILIHSSDLGEFAIVTFVRYLEEGTDVLTEYQAPDGGTLYVISYAHISDDASNLLVKLLTTVFKDH